jgi:hypothetical protein
MTFGDLILACALSSAIHGTDAAIRHTCYLCRDKVERKHSPIVSRLMRHPRVGEWLKLVLEVEDGNA